jgi:adenylate cyclase
MVRSGRRTALVEPAFRQALSDNRSISGRWFDTLHAARFAQTCLDNGRVEAALAWVDSGLADVAQLGQHWYAAELWRLKGAALLRRRTRRAPRGHVQTAPEAAEPYLRRAVEIARAQRARLLELRAATSLAECLRRDGAVHDAVALLAPLCAAFDAGVEPADQRDARRLLIALR